MGVIIVNKYNEYVREAFSAAGDTVIKPMMGGFLVYLNGKLIGDICDNELFLKRTPTSDRLLADSELRYPYEGSKTLMHVSYISHLNMLNYRLWYRCNNQEGMLGSY